MKFILKLSIYLLLFLWCSKIFSNTQIDTTETTNIVCSINKLATFPGDTLLLNAWYPKSLMNYQCSWEVSIGMIHGSGHSVKWILNETTLGIQSVNVKLTFADSIIASDSCQVLIESAKVRGRTIGFDFLVGNDKEGMDYGLYNYLLFGSRPFNKNDTSKYLASIKTYIMEINNILSLKETFRNMGLKVKLGVIYIPINIKPNRPEINQPTAEWILKNYNYERAKAILSLFPQEMHSGPYLISSSYPVSSITKPGDITLIQDLSTVPIHILKIWQREFFIQVAKEKYWERNKIRGLLRDIRTIIAVAADGFPDVKQGIFGLITEFKF